MPYSFATNDETEEEKILKCQPIMGQITEFVELVKKYAANGTYFVRKISAQAMLTLLPFPEFIPQVVDCFQRLKTEPLRQNEAHGLVLRASIFLEAYFKYRMVAVVPEKHG